MFVNKAPPVRMVLTQDERKRIAAFVTMLVKINKRVKAEKNPAVALRAKADRGKKTKEKETWLGYINKARWDCGPSLYLQGIYYVSKSASSFFPFSFF